MADSKRIKKQIIRLTKQRGPDKTICPSEAAKACDPDNWRSHMDEVRRAADELQKQGLIAIEQDSQEIQLEEVRGPIRLRIKRGRG